MSQKRCVIQPKVAKLYDQHAEVVHLIGERLFEKLELIKFKPRHIVDLGTGTGHFLKPLRKRFPEAKIIGVDHSSAMIRLANQKKGWFEKRALLLAEAEKLPFADNSIDMVFANCLLSTCQLQPVIKEVKRIIAPNGLFIFSTFGPDTLKELKAAWLRLDTFNHVNTFIDMHDIGDILLNEKFSDPVMDMEFLTINFESLMGLLNELKYCGSFVKENPYSGLMKASRLKLLEGHYRQDPEGLFPATVEIVYGHAWGRALKNTATADIDGVVALPVNKIQYKRR